MYASRSVASQAAQYARSGKPFECCVAGARPALERHARNRIFLPIDGYAAVISEQASREQCPEIRLMADERNPLAAILGQKRDYRLHGSAR